jgi:transketolase N-terminal domain/subunit
VVLESIGSPADVKALAPDELPQLAEELRTAIVDAVSKVGGHLGSNLGVVELTIALHRVFDSPRDAFVWDTGHQAYAHKMLTGRLDGFATLRQAGGLSGYPSRAESPHDLVENSHASTALSWVSGLARGQASLPRSDRRRLVAIVGDGALTGGMAYEALNNLGHHQLPAIIVLNDNGRSYAETVSRCPSGSPTCAPTRGTGPGATRSTACSAACRWSSGSPAPGWGDQGRRVRGPGPAVVRRGARGPLPRPLRRSRPRPARARPAPRRPPGHAGARARPDPEGQGLRAGGDRPGEEAARHLGVRRRHRAAAVLSAPAAGPTRSARRCSSSRRNARS